jgi:Fur family ferric uptake transcriptional regulator
VSTERRRTGCRGALDAGVRAYKLAWMVDVATEDGTLHSLVSARLRKVDQRYTSGRRCMVELLVAAGRPVSIGDIADLRPEIARSSAYRHLMELQIAGVVRRVASNDEFARFELAEDLTEHHHHLLCVNCGSVVDVTPPAALERAVSKAMADLAGAEGFEMLSHRLDVFGLCPNCR